MVFNALDRLLDDSDPVFIPVPAPSEGSDAVSPGMAVLLREGETPAASPESTGETPIEAEFAESLSVEPSLATATLATPLSSAAGMGQPAGEDPPAFSRGFAEETSQPAASRNFSTPFTVAALLLTLTLAGQLIFYHRTAITITIPALRPALALLSNALGSEIPLPRNADMISIEASDLQTEPGRSKLLVLQTTLHNGAAYEQAYPALELALTDTNDKAIIRRVLLPDEYLPPAALEAQSFAPNANVEVRLWLEAKDISAAGYRLYVFYP